MVDQLSRAASNLQFKGKRCGRIADIFNGSDKCNSLS